MTHIDLTAITLTKGAHHRREDGTCLLEAVAWWAGEPHSDRPACVSPVLAAYGRALNDALPGDRRQGLLELVPLLPGTAGDGLDTARVYLAVDWLVRVYAPACLRLVPALAGDADVLSGLGPVRSPGDAVAAGELARGAASRAAAAWDAARAAWYAAWDAAWYAARAARDAAWYAARAAMDDAWYAARAAARGAARGELAPTVTHLQDSTISLYHAMIQPPPADPDEPTGQETTP